MDRREFLKTCAALGVAVSIPSFAQAKRGEIFVKVGGQWVDITEEVSFIDYHVDERRVNEAISLGPYLGTKDGGYLLQASFDMTVMWSAVTLEDSRGRAWTTADGERWEYREMWFEVGQ